MHLKKLELSGFKSFAKTTVLEFPSRITAIVGPNGSGKSNITEGVRWVLGEQSMKSLRGKKGEDLIWNGSPQVPRMGKASVSLVFDNKDGKIPLEFEEVVFARKIFRDGLNEYYVNDAQVRLKDVVELIAHLGLGEQKHNIISQGEVDRLLLSSSRDRKEMLEEALGLRVYQIKKNETKKRLEATAANIKQAEALVREITPHLKFLKTQAEKSKARGIVEEELRQMICMYFAKEHQEIEQEKKEMHGKSEPFRMRQIKIREELAGLIHKREEEEQKNISAENDRIFEQKIRELSEKRRLLERELGRLEGKLEITHASSQQKTDTHSDQIHFNAEFTQELIRAIREFINASRALLEDEDRVTVIRSHLQMLMHDLENFIEERYKKNIHADNKTSNQSDAIHELERTIRMLHEELHAIVSALDTLQNQEQEMRFRLREAQNALREIDTAIRVKQDEERDLLLNLERIRFDEERLIIREKTFFEERAGAHITSQDLLEIAVPYGGYTSAELRKKAERLRIRLEEIGGIDPSLIKEYEETAARHAFLTKEVEDLKQAASSLHGLLHELDLHIKKDFHEGFAKIKEEFHNYFRIIFGGGRATLDLVSEKKDEESEISAKNGLELSNEDSRETGIDISVDLPRKRIQGLAMLSGGERALTAIALLFAITAVTPPPFLILDETDAALDEVNSQRYAAILKELSKKTQLLLVTHNRETMKCAGILYGVTMGEDGVSKFLSLKFEEAKVYTNR